MLRVCAAPTWQYTDQEEGEEERSSAATSVTLVEGGDDVYPDTYGPWRVCCRCLEPIGDPDEHGLDEHGGTCSLGLVFERCWTCEGSCHFHGMALYAAIDLVAQRISSSSARGSARGTHPAIQKR